MDPGTPPKVFDNCRESPTNSPLFMQNKAKVKIGKMDISIATIKDYDKNNEQSTTNVIQNKANQSQTKPMSK